MSRLTGDAERTQNYGIDVTNNIYVYTHTHRHWHAMTTPVCVRVWNMLVIGARLLISFWRRARRRSVEGGGSARLAAGVLLADCQEPSSSCVGVMVRSVPRGVLVGSTSVWCGVCVDLSVGGGVAGSLVTA